MIPRKCRLCFRLSFAVKDFWDRLIGGRNTCRDVNQQSLDALDRADALSGVEPNCGCENHRASKFSPGVVKNDEMLSLFVFLPIHTNRKGVVKSSLFDHVNTRGRSVQRDSIASVSEINLFVQDFLKAKDDRVWLGVVSAECVKVRHIAIEEKSARAVCVFDTAERGNPAHAELCRSRVIDEADKAELRSELWKAFNGGKVTKPIEYRNGEVWATLPNAMRLRP